MSSPKSEVVVLALGLAVAALTGEHRRPKLPLWILPGASPRTLANPGSAGTIFRIPRTNPTPTREPKSHWLDSSPMGPEHCSQILATRRSLVPRSRKRLPQFGQWFVVF